MARAKKQVIRLPIAGITLTVAGAGGAVTSNLEAPHIGDEDCVEEVIDNTMFETYRDALYTMLLAHSQAGIDVTTKEYLTGVQAIVDAIANI